MDLNYLFGRHQLSLMIADCTSGPEARAAHRSLASHYADLIKDLQLEGGALTPFCAL